MDKIYIEDPDRLQGHLQHAKRDLLLAYMSMSITIPYDPLALPPELVLN